MDDVIKINGVGFNPSSLEFQVYDLDGEEGSGRNQNGEMFRDRKAVKRKIVCTFNGLTDAMASKLLKAVEPVFFFLEYPDPVENKRKTITAYVGDRTMPIFKYDAVKKCWIWETINLNFIER
jgi:hypothetical protein